MHSLFYWTGLVIWALLALATTAAVCLYGWLVALAVAQTCSALRFTLAINRKRTPNPHASFDPAWILSTIWIFKQMWNSNAPEIIGKEGSRWEGIGKWSVNDEPFPTPESETDEDAE